jgi:Zn-dependent metalloprotease
MKRKLTLLSAVALSGLIGSIVAAVPPAYARPTASPDDATVAGAMAALVDNAVQLGFATDHQGAQRLGRDNRVTVSDVMRDDDGSTHVRMERAFAGLPVLGGDFVLHRAADGSWLGASATFSQTLEGLGLTPLVSSVSALTDAAFGTATSLSTSLGAPGLVIDARHGAPALAWDVETGGTQPDGTPSHLHSYVDAITGKVRFRDEAIENVAAHGQSLYVGKVDLQTATQGTSFLLKDLTRGGGYTLDAGNTSGDTTAGCLPLGLSGCPADAAPTQFLNRTNRWGDGTLRDRETVAVDAQYGSNMTWDYYKNVHKRAGVANDGVAAFSRVHYGKDYANAFWSDECACMTYGDGDGTKLGPLVSLDITGHEISHGVTARTAKLAGDGESGSLNEANSDIFGTMIEFYARNPKDVGDYLLGETSFLKKYDKKGRPSALRYMDRPSKDGASPDCWTNKVAQLDVHLGNAIGNHFFYLLAEGSGPKTINGISYDSPTCNHKVISGLGRDQAAKIWYRALTHYFTSATDYSNAREGVVSAAKDLYGAKSKQVSTVNAAWDAVNVHVGQTAAAGGLF